MKIPYSKVLYIYIYIFIESKLNTTETALKKPIKGDIDVEDINIKFLFDEVDDDEANTEGLNLDVDNLF